MKKTILISIAAAAALTSCARVDDRNNINSSHVSSAAEDFVEPVLKGAEAIADYSDLSTEKHGYGQGVQLDDKNRPVGALDFNTRYGKYSAKAITEDEGKLYLTFDQGYENGYTAKILDTLKEKNVKATFFVLQDYAEKNPELVKRMIDEGHTVGNHSVSHYSMPSLSADECREEIMGLHKFIKDEFGYEMTEFRPPMGEFSELSLAVTQECGYETLLWSYAYADWDVNNQPSKEAAFEKLIGAVHDGAVYLLHSVSSVNAEILGDFIDSAREQGFEFA